MLNIYIFILPLYFLHYTLLVSLILKQQFCRLWTKCANIRSVLRWLDTVAGQEYDRIGQDWYRAGASLEGMGEGTCRRGVNLHAYPKGGRAASGWHKGGRSYGVSTTPLPKSALALPSNLPTYHPCIRARLRLEPSVLSTLQPLSRC